ncbi:hypothetical protein DENSPDRAFT_836974 [Dentipellis sp. KUC8613]|nr:hypothetical protein DENSPDRAFT_836974 [Dentipellis sp. KUC8613]
MSTPRESNLEAEGREGYLRLDPHKHRRDEILNVVTETGRLRKTPAEASLQVYLTAARWIPYAIDPFVNITCVFWVGTEMGFEAEAAPETSSEDFEAVFTSSLTESEISMYRKYYQVILALAPGFPIHMTRLLAHEDTDALSVFLKRITQAANSARTDDAGSLRYVGLNYVPRELHKDALIPPIPKQATKADRGFNHPMLARLLCPRKLLEQFDEDPNKFIASVQNGSIIVAAWDWPAFLYEHETYDRSALDKGLCRGYFLLRVGRHLITSPSSATKSTPGSCSAKPSKAKIHGITKVTPYLIAYFALHARFLISTMETWGREDGSFDMQQFYQNIVNLFEDDLECQWSIDTLKWWNERIFGPQSTASATRKRSMLQDPDSDASLLSIQRASRRQRAD